MTDKKIEMTNCVPNDAVLVIGGHCPTTRAGVVRDCIAINDSNAHSCAVATCTTAQNDRDVFDISWLPIEQVGKQLSALSGRHYKWAKIGVLESHEMAAFVFEALQKREVRIIWDPVLRSSGGTPFYRHTDVCRIRSLLQFVDILTPNRDECLAIFGTTDIQTISDQIRSELPHLRVVLKDGHGEAEIITDVLITSQNVVAFNTRRIPGSAHGTGCVFAATLAAGLVNNMSLNVAIPYAQSAVANHILKHPLP